MARYTLKDAHLRNAKSGDHHDGGGLFLRVKSSGTKSWFYQWTAPPNFTVAKGRKAVQRPKMGLGAYPTITLAGARDKADRCRALVSEGTDPRSETTALSKPETFRDAAEKLFELKRDALKDGGTAGRWMSPLEYHVFPHIGDTSVVQISLDDLVEVLQPIWARDVGRKAFDRIGQVLTNAKARNPAVLSDVSNIKESLKALLPQINRKNAPQPALPWEEMPALWMALSDSVAHTAFKFYLLNVPRTANVTGAEWSEIDFDAGVWDIPEENMKMDNAFSAPLAKQSQKLLRTAKQLFEIEGSDYIFPSAKAHRKGRVSENTWGKWLRENGWKAADGRHAVAHGFRATFATWCGDNEVCDAKMAARCIQHKVESAQDAVYLRSKLLTQRLRIMQRWADYVTSGELEAAASKSRALDFAERLGAIAEPSGRTHSEVESWARPTEDDLREARDFEDAQEARRKIEVKDHYSQDD